MEIEMRCFWFDYPAIDIKPLQTADVPETYEVKK